jgi:hypothetical protein
MSYKAILDISKNYKGLNFSLPLQDYFFKNIQQQFKTMKINHFKLKEL